MFWDYQCREDCFPLLKSPFLCGYFLTHTSKEHCDKFNNSLIHSFNKHLLSVILGTKSSFKCPFPSGAQLIAGEKDKEISYYRTRANATNQDCTSWNASPERHTYWREESEKASQSCQCSTKYWRMRWSFLGAREKWPPRERGEYV